MHSVFVPVVKSIDESGDIREMPLWSMANDIAAFQQSKTRAEMYFGQFADVWAETYRDMGREVLSIRVAEYREV